MRKFEERRELFVDVEVVIELKNDKEVRGLVRSCDEDMNVLLENVSIKKFNEEFEFFEEMLVKGKSIRFIHYPTFINLETETRLQMKKLKEKEKTRQPPKIVEKVTSIFEKRKIEEIVLDNSKSVDIDNDDER